MLPERQFLLPLAIPLLCVHVFKLHFSDVCMHACYLAILLSHKRRIGSLSSPRLIFQECLLCVWQLVAVNVLCAFSHSIWQKGKKSQLYTTVKRYRITS